jgi:phosphoadenosine phosphosulfate reductase
MNAVERYAQASVSMASKVRASLGLLTHTGEQHPGPWAQAHSLGAEDVVVTHLLHMAGWFERENASVFVLDTGKLHPQTIELIAAIESRYNVAVNTFKPDASSLISLVKDIGDNGIFDSKENRLACCRVRKVQPLAKALENQTGWVTGIRREQSAMRAQIDPIEQDGARLKLNPLADWTWGDVWAFIEQHGLAYNALHDKFYPSIGCAPCTRAISLGEDFRAGRWWWESGTGNGADKECGLHLKPPVTAAPKVLNASHKATT